MLSILIIGVLILFSLFVIGLFCLRLMSRKCPNCGHYTMKREGRGFRCSNGHCDCLFTEQEKEG